MKSGILVVNKPRNMTSRDVVNIVCKKLNTKHIGHTGTLDPLATGVLVLGVNDGCKVIELLTSVDKEYIASVIVGIETDTLDVTGEVLKTYNIETLDQQKLEEVLDSFRGKYMQEVPKYSAVHVDGKRLYEYARNQEQVVLPKREVEIKEIELLDLPRLRDGFFTFSFRVHVSKGTYIRSLIRDIGMRLGWPCTMQKLERTRQGIFSLRDSLDLEDVLEDKLISISKTLAEYERLIVDSKLELKVRNGAILDGIVCDSYLLILNQKEELLAIYQPYQKDLTKIKPYKVFGGMGNEKTK